MGVSNIVVPIAGVAMIAFVFVYYLTSRRRPSDAEQHVGPGSAGEGRLRLVGEIMPAVL